MNSPAINEHRVHVFLEGLFGEDLNAKSVLSLSLATLGGIQAASLSVERLGMERCRTYGLFRQGCFYCQALPHMREAELRPLIESLAQLVIEQPVFREVFGLV